MVGCGRYNRGGKSGTHTRLHQVEKMREQDELNCHGLVLLLSEALWTRNRVESCTTYTRLTTLLSGHRWVLLVGGISSLSFFRVRRCHRISSPLAATQGIQTLREPTGISFLAD